MIVSWLFKTTVQFLTSQIVAECLKLELGHVYSYSYGRSRDLHSYKQYKVHLKVDKHL